MNEVINQGTGELIQIPEELQEVKAVELYKNASMLVISPEEQKKLEAPVDPDLVEIRPDGLLYLPQVFYRQKLNETFGAGQWAIIMLRDIVKDNKFFYDGCLLVRGHFISRCMGESEYHENNPLQSWASALESAKSDCLVRCCKDLGIGKEVWMPQFTRDWVSKHAIKVWREKTGKKKDGTPGSFQWRLKTSEPFYDEKGQSGNNNNEPADNRNNPPADNKQNNSAPQNKSNDNKNNSPAGETDHDKKVKLFHEVGKKFYGDTWNKRGSELVQALTKKRKQGKPTSKSSACTIAELDILINGIQKLIDDQEKAIKDQHKKAAQQDSTNKNPKMTVAETAIFDTLKKKFTEVDNGIDLMKMLNSEGPLIDLLKDEHMQTEIALLINKKAKELGVDLKAA